MLMVVNRFAPMSGQQRQMAREESLLRSVSDRNGCAPDAGGAVEMAYSAPRPPPRNEVKPEDLLLLVTRTMPYGKYKDRLLADLPGHYLNWFARAGFPNGELGQLLALMHEIDHNGLSELLTPLRKSRPRSTTVR